LKLAAIANHDPARFHQIIHDPVSVTPGAKCRHKDYDDATLNALTAYFKTSQAYGANHDHAYGQGGSACRIGLYYALVVFNNITDFDSNYQFVRHVLSMDSTFPATKAWRALPSAGISLAFYLGIIGVKSSPQSCFGGRR